MYNLMVIKSETVSVLELRSSDLIGCIWCCKLRSDVSCFSFRKHAWTVGKSLELQCYILSPLSFVARVVYASNKHFTIYNFFFNLHLGSECVLWFEWYFKAMNLLHSLHQCPKNFDISSPMDHWVRRNGFRSVKRLVFTILLKLILCSLFIHSCRTSIPYKGRLGYASTLC